MSKDELIKELDRLSELNKTTNPIAASILLTLAGLCITNEEGILAIATAKINDHFLTRNKSNNEN